MPDLLTLDSTFLPLSYTRLNTNDPLKTINYFINNGLKNIFISYKKQPLPIDKTWISPYILFLTDQLYTQL